MDNKTSLEKSHSKWSNFKLTCLCILITLSISSLWVLISFKDYFRFVSFVIVGFSSIAILVLSIILLSKFKR
ncbi:MAG: hypothetical protein E7183_05705 [Erysipelotrichaceae bacterium]|nr:hypothetical protein [Erysipelotrichaceae bacterium]